MQPVITIQRACECEFPQSETEIGWTLAQPWPPRLFWSVQSTVDLHVGANSMFYNGSPPYCNILISQPPPCNFDIKKYILCKSLVLKSCRIIWPGTTGHGEMCFSCVMPSLEQCNECIENHLTTWLSTSTLTLFQFNICLFTIFVFAWHEKCLPKLNGLGFVNLKYLQNKPLWHKAVSERMYKLSFL